MNKLKDALNRFLQGRYGMDQLGQALFVVYLAFFVLNIVTRNSIFYTLGFIVVIFFLYRCLSRNFEARQKENNYYMDQYNKAARFFRLQKRKWQDRNTHVYRKCPYCHTTIRLPKVKGKHGTSCQKCKKGLGGRGETRGEGVFGLGRTRKLRPHRL